MAANADIYQNVTDKMIAALEAGTVPWKQPWKGGAANAPRNAASGRPYRGINPLILGWEALVRGFTDNRWLTFKQAMALKGTFKGEKGDDIRKSTEIVLWKPLPKPMLDASGAPILVNGKPQMRVFFLLRTFRVFNVEQFEGLKIKPLEEAVPDKKETIASAQAIVDGYVGTERGPKLLTGYPHACYYPITDRIEVPAFDQFTTAEAAYATMFHEMGHSTLHPTRLDRKGTDEAGTHPFGSKHYSLEELVAEMTSTFLATTAGIETTLDNSAAYLAHWIKILKEDNQIILSAAGKAQRAADFILGITFETENTDE